jgi:hypothetical protein
MKKILLIAIVLLIGCKSQKPITQVELKDTIKITQKVDTIVLPQDSSLLEALFFCDSTNSVMLKELNEQKTNNISSDFNLKEGKLTYKTKVIRDTAYVYSVDTLIVKSKPVRVVKEVNILSKFQRWLIFIGLLGVAFFVYKIIRIFV